MRPIISPSDGTFSKSFVNVGDAVNSTDSIGEVSLYSDITNVTPGSSGTIDQIQNLGLSVTKGKTVLYMLDDGVTAKLKAYWNGAIEWLKKSK